MWLAILFSWREPLLYYPLSNHIIQRFSEWSHHLYSLPLPSLYDPIPDPHAQITLCAHTPYLTHRLICRVTFGDPGGRRVTDLMTAGIMRPDPCCQSAGLIYGRHLGLLTLIIIFNKASWPFLKMYMRRGVYRHGKTYIKWHDRGHSTLDCFKINNSNREHWHFKEFDMCHRGPHQGRGRRGDRWSGG